MMNDSKAKNIEMVLLDVDGVMTDGAIYISGTGEAFKSFNVQDGLAIELPRSHGIKTGVISGKSSYALSTRCEQLGFDVIITGCKNKVSKIASISQEFGIRVSSIAFCGYDVLDLLVFNKVGLSVCPADAHQLALEEADWVMSAKGVQGMVREFVDKLLMEKTGASLPEIFSPLLAKIQADIVR
ncbi:3-deoxy-manno-octulosonate-8-phosphatase [Vibrio alginolyticus]|nr:3-deoxy-manno-octulosonate-8-phosphatase [Vibrio alginolyticus]